MKKRIFWIAALALAFALSAGRAKIIKPPYLQAASDSGVVVLVESDSKTPPLARFGTSRRLTRKAKASFRFSAAKRGRPTMVYRIKLAGLKPSTRYFYKVIDGKDKSRLYSFKTFPKSKKTASFRFAILGDNRSNPKIFAKIVKAVEKKKPLFSLYLGDLAYNSSYEKWAKEFFVKENLNFCASVPFFNAVGNHESWTKNSKAYLQSPSSKPGENSPYYSFDCGDAHFLILCSELSLKKGSPQYEFAKKDLEKNAKARWKFVAVHEPGYCAGGHGENRDVIELSKRLFVPAKVSAVFAGHSHFYQRNEKDGLVHFVLGGAGAPLYSPKKAPYVKKTAKAYCYAIADLRPDFVKIRVFNLKGGLIDEKIIKRK